MKLRCIIIEDEPVARQGLAADIQEIGFIEIVGMAENALRALDIIQLKEPDLIFLDIEMPKLKGIELVKMIANPPMAIITTAYPEFALEGYQLNVIDYLLKPVAFSRLLTACNKAKELFELRRNVKQCGDIMGGYFFIKCGGKLEKILYDDVLLVEAANNYVTVHTTGKSFLTYQTLKNMEAALPGNCFTRVHKSYIVAINKITRIDGSNIIVQKHTIPLSRNYRDDVMQKVIVQKAIKR